MKSSGFRCFLHRFSLFSLLALTLGPAFVQAAGTFVSAAQRVDAVYNESRDILFISNGSQILRYLVSSGVYMEPLELGGSLKGMDLSPDGNTLAIADAAYDAGSNTNWIHLLDLGAMTAQRISFTRSFSEGGTFTVAYGADGSLLVSSTFLGSGSVPLRKYVPATGAVTTLASVQMNTMLRASADGSVIGFAESNISDGRFGRYRVSDGNLLRKQGYTDGTAWFNYEIAVSRNGDQYALPTYGGTFVTDASLIKRAGVIGQYAGPQPVGVAYHPLRNIVFFPWSGTSSVHAYDSTTLQKIAEYDFEKPFTSNGNHAFVNGRLRISRSGRLLLATVDGGVHFIRFANELPMADAKNVIVPEDAPRTITLSGSDPEGRPLAYAITTAPLHGSLSGSGAAVVYSPQADFNGTDSFSYVVNDGEANSAPALVDISVTAVNDAPQFALSVANVSVRKNSGRATISAAGAISVGPADEAGQLVSFVLGNNNSSLFSEQPAMASNGTLTFKPGTGKRGTATVTVFARDNGGVANGGQDQSLTASFVIEVGL